jgi:hypothetical protein
MDHPAKRMVLTVVVFALGASLVTIAEWLGQR